MLCCGKTYSKNSSQWAKKILCFGSTCAGVLQSSQLKSVLQIYFRTCLSSRVGSFRKSWSSPASSLSILRAGLRQGRPSYFAMRIRRVCPSTCMYLSVCMHVQCWQRNNSACASAHLACVCKIMWRCMYVCMCALCSAQEGFWHVYSSVVCRCMYVFMPVYTCALLSKKQLLCVWER